MRASDKRCCERPEKSPVPVAFFPLPPFSGSGWIIATAMARWPWGAVGISLVRVGVLGAGEPDKPTDSPGAAPARHVHYAALSGRGCWELGTAEISRYRSLTRGRTETDRRKVSSPYCVEVWREPASV